MQEIQFLNPGGLLSSESSQIYTQQIKSLPRSPQTKTKAVHSCKGQCHDICIASFFFFRETNLFGPLVDNTTVHFEYGFDFAENSAWCRGHCRIIVTTEPDSAVSLTQQSQNVDICFKNRIDILFKP